MAFPPDMRVLLIMKGDIETCTLRVKRVGADGSWRAKRFPGRVHRGHLQATSSDRDGGNEVYDTLLRAGDTLEIFPLYLRRGSNH